MVGGFIIGEFMGFESQLLLKGPRMRPAGPARKMTKCNDTISLSHGTDAWLETDLFPFIVTGNSVP
jgi:hypothetical protein